MKLEDQVCSLEWAKKLKELGVGQDGLYSWSVPNPEKTATEVDRYALENKCSVILTEHNYGERFDSYSAFTVAELGVMFPLHLCIETSIKTQYRKKYTFQCYSAARLYSQKIPHVYAKTEADARAAMLVYLLENKLITP